MKYEIYCDESGVEALFDKDAHKYAVIGGIWIPAEERGLCKSKVISLKKKYGLMGEMKWNKVCPSSMDFYKEIVTSFFENENIRFRAICIKAEQLNHEKYNLGKGKLGFYKFYFQLLQHWLVWNNTYQIFVDYKVNGYPHRVYELGRILNNATSASVSQIQALPSEQSVLIQLADVLTGAVSASFNKEYRIGSAKEELLNVFNNHLGHAIKPTSVSEEKFNVFEIKLRQGW